MTFQTDDRARVRRQRSERAIKLAMASQWEEAAQENQAILALFPRDVDAHNRLGKAMTELGRYADARAAYRRAMELDGNNAIARKNLLRLEALGDEAAPPSDTRQKVDPDLFIEETGKTGITQLQRPDRDFLQRMTAGDKIELKRQGNALVVETITGERLGLVEPRLALRLTRLIDGGNTYAAAIASVSPSGDQGRIIIKETYQSPANIGRLSFPTTGPEGVRPYTKESLLRYDLDDDEAEGDETEGGDDWESEPEAAETTEVSFDYEKSREMEDDRGDDYDA
ncbi:MAG: tetratricopeptide repeat protein [Dehalococcoidia bacterium]